MDELTPTAETLQVPMPEPAPVQAPAVVRVGAPFAAWRDALVTWVGMLASAAVYATLLVTFGFQVARVEGHSMQPTLQDQDRLLVNKLAYEIGDPHVGDIVMLYEPDDPDRALVKRVIGEPGDTIRIDDGKVYRNGVALRDDFIPAEFRSHDNWGPWPIRPGFYFVMGDHRNNSSDSRVFGQVPKKYIIGKIPVRWWPFGQARVFTPAVTPGTPR